jgi:hypothetical protein
MENIFIEHNISIDYFNMSFNITSDLWYYLYDNLVKQKNISNYLFDLRNALTTNANE